MEEATVAAGFFATLMGLGFWFWGILVVGFILLTIFVEREADVGTILTTLAIILGLQFIADINIFLWVKSNPMNLVYYLGMYTVAGVLWSFFKWTNLVSRVYENYNEKKVSWLEDRKVKNYEKGVIPNSLKEDWTKFCRHNAHSCDLSNDNFGETPSARKNKGRITRWIGYWPASFFFFVFKDMLIELWNAVYRRFARWYQVIANRKFRRVSDDFAITEE